MCISRLTSLESLVLESTGTFPYQCLSALPRLTTLDFSRFHCVVNEEDLKRVGSSSMLQQLIWTFATADPLLTLTHLAPLAMNLRLERFVVPCHFQPYLKAYETHFERKLCRVVFE